MDEATITEQMLELSEDLAARFLNSCRDSRSEAPTWQGAIDGKHVTITYCMDSSYRTGTVGGHADRVLDEYSVTITGYYPPDGDFSECLQTPDFEVAIAKTILHELIHITDPELADGSQWIEPNTVSTSDPNYFGHPREQRAFLGEFHAAIRVLSRHLGAANTDPRALREVVRLSVMANTTSTFRRWMEGAGRLDIYEDALDRALDANPRFRVGGP